MPQPRAPPPEACNTTLPREAEYKTCFDQAALQAPPEPAIESCKTLYVNNVLQDYLNKCYATYPSQQSSCQNTFAPTASFANCLAVYKNPIECAKVYGFVRIVNPVARIVSIPENTIPGIDPFQDSIGSLLANGLQIVFIVAGLLVLIYLVIGAFKWITSGGDKDAIGKARGTIVAALVGLTILALAFFMTVLFGQILGINILDFKELPTLNQKPSPAP